MKTLNIFTLVATVIGFYPLLSVAGELEDLKLDIEVSTKRASDLNSDIKKLEAELSEYKLVEGKQTAIDALKQERVASVKTIESLEKKLRDIAYVALAYRNQFQNKSSFAKDEQLGSITLKSGRKLEGVKVMEVGSNQLRVGHSGGFAMIPLSDLPNALGSRILIPPATGDLANPKSVLGNRPQFLDTGTTIIAEGTEPENNKKSDKKSAKSTAIAEKESKRIGAMTERNQLRAKKDSLLKEIGVLRRGYSVQSSNKFGAISELNKQRIRPSATKIQEVTDSYDAKLAQIDLAIKAKQAEIKKIDTRISEIATFIRNL